MEAVLAENAEGRGGDPLANLLLMLLGDPGHRAPVDFDKTNVRSRQYRIFVKASVPTRAQLS